jgi:dipeptidyl-peptidase-4
MKKLTVILFIFAIFAGWTQAQTQQITLEDIWEKGTFRPDYVPGFQSMPLSDCYTVVSRSGIDKHLFATGELVETLMKSTRLTELTEGRINIRTVDEYSFDAQEKKILLAIEQEVIYRRSSKAFYYVYDIQKDTLIAVADTQLGKQSFATFSPQGDKVAFVRDNNLFISDLNTGKETQITTDGKYNHIINGMADWVYEEELSLAQAFAWSPDGSKIAYYRFDESEVKQFSMTLWGELYPEEYTYKYPKPGEANSKISLFYYDLNTQKSYDLGFDPNEDCYYPRIFWSAVPNQLIVMKLNRKQTEMQFFAIDLPQLAKKVIYNEKLSVWIDIPEEVLFLQDGKRFLFTSEREGYNHIYISDYNQKLTPMTTGEWEVAEILYIDQKEQKIYYLSNESGIHNRDLYVIGFNGKKKQLLSSGNGWSTAEFSTTGSFYKLSTSDLNTPPVHAIYDKKGKQLRVLADNGSLKNKMQEYGFSQKEMINFQTAEGTTLYGWMLKPLDFDANKKYPVLIYCYGGPGSQEVMNGMRRMNDDFWYQMLAQKGYIVVCVDGRGTGARGADFKKQVYLNMGKMEAEDQINVAKYLQSLPYVDAQRIGIWGWSFGGYLSTLAMMKGEGIFKAVIAVAPVTNWRYYDNIYTERFLTTPEENPKGYDDNSPIFFADQASGNYLLIHGTADDNVHFQNAIELVMALNKAGFQYEQFFYPNKNHFIYGGKTRLHLYTKLTDFIMKNL